VNEPPVVILVFNDTQLVKFVEASTAKGLLGWPDTRRVGTPFVIERIFNCGGGTVALT
jgi:hypothetical protein